MATLNQRIIVAAAASWVGRAMVIAAKMLLTAILFRSLSESDLGLWFLMMQSAALVVLLDLGLPATVARRLAIIKGELSADPGVPLTAAIGQRIADVLRVSRWSFAVVTVIAFLANSALGLALIWWIAPPDPEAAITAWVVMGAAHACTLWAHEWIAALRGLGHLGWDAVTLTVSGLVVVSLQLAALLLMPSLVGRPAGLLELAAIALGGALIHRWLTAYAVRARQPELADYRGSWDAGLVAELKPLALQAWVTNLGAFLILKTDEYFIAVVLGAERIPGYSAVALIVLNLHVLALTMTTSSDVFISQCWRAGDVDAIHKMLIRNLRLGLCVMLTGVACLATCGAELFTVWLGPGRFVGYGVLLTMCLTMTLETQHVAIASASRATEDEPFGRCAMISAVLNLSLTAALIVPLGLWGVALGTCIAQLLTSNWYVVYRGLARLELPLSSLLRQVVLPCLTVFALTTAGCWLITRALAPYGALAVMSGGLVGSAIGLLSAILVMGLRRLDLDREAAPQPEEPAA